jgi:hypothetical protein
MTGHNFPLQKVENGEAPTYPHTTVDFVPPHFSNGWSDVSYVIGGFAWKYNLIDQDGYIYTGDDAQYNFQDAAAVPYHADLDPGTKKYDCGRCHTTGWVSVADGGAPQDEMPGMDGEFFAGGVQCEACHGIGSVHAASRDAADINMDVDPAECQRCHNRTEDNTIAAMDGFIRNYSQHEEILAAGHQQLACIDCHDPHNSVKHGEVDGIMVSCTDCHSGLNNTSHHGAECTTCHMPYASKSASSTNKYVADVKTHIFKINTAADGEMFNQDGTIANGETGVTLGYVCYQCHRDDAGVGGGGSAKTLQQLSNRATGFHD